VRLNWKGATSPNIDIYRNNMLIATQPNDPESILIPPATLAELNQRFPKIRITL
jgi:hypothetical protein